MLHVDHMGKTREPHEPHVDARLRHEQKLMRLVSIDMSYTWDKGFMT